MTFPAPTQRRNPLPIIIAIVVGLLAICGVYVFLANRGDGGNDGDGNATAPRRDGCITLDIAASSEKAALLGQLADEYIRKDRRFDGKCADPKVTSKASGAALDALASGWDATRDGPVPQVWTPAASSWVGLLRQRLSVGDKGNLVPDGKIPTIAQSPLVLAMPKPMAEKLGWPDTPIGWSDVLGLTNDPQGWASKGEDWGKFKLGKTNPHFSTSGLNATIGAYYAATGRSTDLTEKDLADPKVLQYVKSVESGVVHYGDTTLTFLSNLAAADQAGEGLSYISAVTLEEKSVYDYNQGNPTGDPALLGKGPKPRQPLVAVYPKEGTLLSDHPFVVLSNASEEQKAAAADFLKFVQDTPQQTRFTDAAFRTYDGKVGAGLTKANGLLPDAKFTVIDPPSPAVLEGALTTWDAQRKRARVLLVLDVSGSMTQPAGNGGQTRMALAKQAALQSLSLFAPDDEVGLWTFSTEVGGAPTPWTEQVGVAALKDNKAQLEKVITGLVPEGGTALYATTRAAQKKLADTADPTRINAVVVLTDGKNEYKDNDLDALVRDVDTTRKEIAVRVFTIAYGGQADLGVLQRISTASRAAAYDASDPTTIDKVLVNVLSNF